MCALEISAIVTTGNTDGDRTANPGIKCSYQGRSGNNNVQYVLLCRQYWTISATLLAGIRNNNFRKCRRKLALNSLLRY